MTSLCALYIALASLQQCLEKQADPVIRLEGRKAGQQPQSGKPTALRHSKYRRREGARKYPQSLCCQNIELSDNSKCAYINNNNNNNSNTLSLMSKTIEPTKQNRSCHTSNLSRTTMVPLSLRANLELTQKFHISMRVSNSYLQHQLQNFRPDAAIF